MTDSGPWSPVLSPSWEPWHCVCGKDTLLPQCFSMPRRLGINGYQEIVGATGQKVGAQTMMDKQLYPGGH